VTSAVNATSRKPRVLVLTPVYNEEQGLLRYEQQVREVLLGCDDCDFGVLFVEDGSHDRSWQVIQEIARRDGRFQGLRLSRNYGSHVALSAGLAAADADCVATLACDLQDPPEVVLDFVTAWRKGAHIVWGKRRSRDDSPWRVVTSNLFHALLKRFAMPRGSKFTTGSFLLADRRVVECVRRFGEQNRIIFALVAWTGFEQDVVEYDRKQRLTGRSGWTFSRLVKTLYDALVGFSSLPIRVMTVLGCGAVLVTVLLALYLLTCFATGHPAPGWTSIMLGNAFFFGVQFLLMGLSGEYLHRIYLEAVKRPLYFVSDRTAGAAPEQRCPVCHRLGGEGARAA
jgi:dolichol-phosphate mannosyltransferase